MVYICDQGHNTKEEPKEVRDERIYENCDVSTDRKRTRRKVLIHFVSTNK